MIYLKTYVYAPHEIDFVILNLLEAYPHIDKFIVCEFNRKHTGHPKDFIFEGLLNMVPTDIADKLAYFKCDISKEAVFADTNEDAIHRVNEPLMRTYFTRCMPFNGDDVVISIDADEIIYGHIYPDLLDHVWEHGSGVLQLHQFMYKPTYLWKDHPFVAPTAALYRVGHTWRYEGTVFPTVAGCHFSWCMSVDAMIEKLFSYSHPQYRFCANRQLLEDAIREKTYPFDPTTPFTIEEIPLSSPLLPAFTSKVFHDPA